MNDSLTSWVERWRYRCVFKCVELGWLSEKRAEGAEISSALANISTSSKHATDFSPH